MIFSRNDNHCAIYHIYHIQMKILSSSYRAWTKKKKRGSFSGIFAFTVVGRGVFGDGGVGAVGWGCGLGLWVLGKGKERRWGWGRRWGREMGKGDGDGDGREGEGRGGEGVEGKGREGEGKGRGWGRGGGGRGCIRIGGWDEIAWSARLALAA